MKKKLGIILAILLCAVLVFTLVACGNKDNNGSDPADPAGSGTTKLEGVEDAQIASKEADLQAFLNNWVSIHATEEEEDQTNLLKTDLNGQKNLYKLNGTTAYPATFNVKYAGGKYTVTVSWGQGAVTKEVKADAKTVTYSNWSGKYSNTGDEGYTFLEDKTAASDTLDIVATAIANTVNKVTGNVVTGKFGLDGVLGFDAFGASYGLRVKGNIDVKTPAATNLGLVIVNGETGKELAGIYYQGAATAKESRLYFQLLTEDEEGEETYTYKYLEYADILGYVNALLKDKDGNSIVKNEASDGVFGDAEIDGLQTFLEAVGVPDSVTGFIPGVVNMIAKAYQNEEEGVYLIDINLAEVIGKVSDIMSMINVDLAFLDDFGIDLTTMHGLFGHIAIGAKITGEDIDEYELSDLELAVNTPKDCHFYFTADESEDAMQLDIPSIGFAIYLEDFDFVTDGTVANVVPQAAIDGAAHGRGYFSPTNLDMSGDVYINHLEGADANIDSTFHFALVTDVNPLEILENGFDSEAKAALVIKKHAGEVAYNATATGWENFLSISYEQKSKDLTVSGTAFKLDDGETLYTCKINQDTLDDIKMWLGLTNWIGLDLDPEKGIVIDNNKSNGPAKESAQAIFGNKLVQALMQYYMDRSTAEEPVDETDGNLSEASVMDQIGDYVDGVKAIYDALVEKDIISFSMDPFSFSLNVTDESIKEIAGMINDTFGSEEKEIITEDGLAKIKDLKIVKVEANSKDYADQVYIEVEYGDDKYTLLFDGSKDKKFIITFTLTKKSNRTYTVTFDATSGIDSWTASVSVDIKDADGEPVDSTKVTLSDFHAEWGNDNTEEVAALLPSAEAKKGASEIFPTDGTGPATQLVKGLLGILSSDKVYDTALKLGQFVIRQIA